MSLLLLPYCLLSFPHDFCFPFPSKSGNIRRSFFPFLFLILKVVSFFGTVVNLKQKLCPLQGKHDSLLFREPSKSQCPSISFLKSESLFIKIIQLQFLRNKTIHNSMELIKTLGNDSRDKKKSFFGPQVVHINMQIEIVEVKFLEHQILLLFFCKKSGWKQ